MGNKHSVEDEELYNEIKSSHTFPSSEGATFTLGDGRKLGYMEYGNKDSKNVILFFHPTPGCRLFCPPVKQQVKKTFFFVHFLKSFFSIYCFRMFV